MVRRRFVVALLATLGLAASVWAFSGPGELVEAPAGLTFAGPVLDETKTAYVMVLIYPGGSTTARISVEIAARGFAGPDGKIDVDQMRVVLRNALVDDYRRRVGTKAVSVDLRA